MVLIDTSVWVRAFAGQARFRAGVAALLDHNEAAGHNLVYGELLIGDTGGRRKFLSDYGLIYQATLVPHHEVVAFVHGRNLRGRGVGWIDVHLLASALVERLELWTADQLLRTLAEEFAVAYRPPD